MKIAVKMTCCALALAFHNGAMGAEIPTDSLKIAAGVVKAPGYETPPAKAYIVANSTNIFSDHAVYGTDITGQLKLGEKVEVLAKVQIPAHCGQRSGDCGQFLMSV